MELGPLPPHWLEPDNDWYSYLVIPPNTDSMISYQYGKDGWANWGKMDNDGNTLLQIARYRADELRRFTAPSAQIAVESTRPDGTEYINITTDDGVTTHHMNRPRSLQPLHGEDAQ